jgi:hypothetical protein
MITAFDDDDRVSPKFGPLLDTKSVKKVRIGIYRRWIGHSYSTKPRIWVLHFRNFKSLQAAEDFVRESNKQTLNRKYGYEYKLENQKQ